MASDDGTRRSCQEHRVSVGTGARSAEWGKHVRGAYWPRRGHVRSSRILLRRRNVVRNDTWALAAPSVREGVAKNFCIRGSKTYNACFTTTRAQNHSSREEYSLGPTSELSHWIRENLTGNSGIGWGVQTPGQIRGIIRPCHPPSAFWFHWDLWFAFGKLS